MSKYEEVQAHQTEDQVDQKLNSERRKPKEDIL